MNLSFVEINKGALISNLKSFRRLIGCERVLAVAVKANAYGHGLIECSKIFSENGADYLCVNAVFEAEEIRSAGITTPILIIGYTPLSDLEKAIKLKCELIVYNIETIKNLIKLDKKVDVHLKIETGNHRQGIYLKEIPEILKILKKSKKINLKGASTHFANIEDRINHEYALTQIKVFNKAVELIEESGFPLKYKHCANSAATMILPESHFNFARVGIGAYGLWPSDKTKQSAEKHNKKITLKPVMSWKTIVSQVKDVKKDSLVGYGCTYKMPRNGQIAIIPVGYYDGFVRAVSNKGYVLIKGQKAPVIGRVCMNIIMVDITDIPGVKIEDEVVLIGKQSKNQITAEDMGEWSNTINYEVVTRINERILRIVGN